MSLSYWTCSELGGGKHLDCRTMQELHGELADELGYVIFVWQEAQRKNGLSSNRISPRVLFSLNVEHWLDERYIYIF